MSSYTTGAFPNEKTLAEITLAAPAKGTFIPQMYLMAGRVGLHQFLKRRKIRCDTDRAYSILRANTQLNEAVNKLWAATELYLVLDNKNAVFISRDGFSKQFGASSIITLAYYAQLSNLLAICSIFGVVFEKNKNGKELIIVKTKGGWVTMPREQFLNGLGIRAGPSLHKAVYGVYTYLLENSYEVPKIDLVRLNELKKMRAIADYKIIGATSLRGSGHLANEELDSLIFVIDSLVKTSDIISDIWGVNNCGKRLNQMSVWFTRLVDAQPYIWKIKVSEQKQCHQLFSQGKLNLFEFYLKTGYSPRFFIEQRKRKSSISP